jgi:hypothetical protein
LPSLLKDSFFEYGIVVYNSFLSAFLSILKMSSNFLGVCSSTKKYVTHLWPLSRYFHYIWFLTVSNVSGHDFLLVYPV